jgi:hypothetical protein
MITRRESLKRFARIGLLAPLGLVACAGDMGLPIEEELAWEEAAAAAPEGADVFVVKLDPEAAREHMEAMSRCLAERGVTLPAGPHKFRIHKSPGEAAHAAGEGAPHRVIYIARPDGAEHALDGARHAEAEVVPLDDATQKAFAACAAQIGPPASRRP